MKIKRPALSIVLALVALSVLSGSVCRRTVIRDGVRVSVDEAREIDLAKADAALEEDRLDEAITRLERFQEEFPRSNDQAYVLAKLGEAYYKKGEHERAAVYFQRVLDEYPKQPEAALAAWGLCLDAFRMDNCDKIEALVLEYRYLAEDSVWDRMTLLQAECKLKSDDKLSALYLFGEEVRHGKDSELQGKAVERAEALAREMPAEQLETVAGQHPEEFPGDLALVVLIEKLADQDRIDRAQEFAVAFEDGFTDSTYQAEFDILKDLLDRRKSVKYNRIGVLLPVSGRLSGYGERALKGIMLAGKVFDEAGPIQPSELIIRDTGGEDADIEALVTELVEDEHVLAIVGPLRTSYAERAGKKAQELNVPLVALSPGEEIPAIGDWVYQNSLTKSSQVEAIVDYAIAGQGLTSLGVLYPNDSYGEDFSRLFMDRVAMRGGSVVAAESYDLSSTDFKDQIRSLKKQGGKNGIQALFIPDDWGRVAMIAPQIRYYKLEDVRLLGINAWHDDRLIQKTQPEDLIGAVFTDGISPELSMPAFNDFTRRFGEEYDALPDLVASQAYESVSLLLHIVKEYRVRDRRQLKRALDHITRYPGVLGAITVEESGFFRKPVYIYAVGEDRFRVISTFE